MSQLVCAPHDGETGDAGWCTFWAELSDRCGLSCAAAGERAIRERVVARYKKEDIMVIDEFARRKMNNDYGIVKCIGLVV